MVRTALVCGSTDGRSFTWLALSSLRTRVGISGAYHIICSQSRSVKQSIRNQRFTLGMAVFMYHS